PAEPDNGNPGPAFHIEQAQRRVRRDASAKQRRGIGGWNRGRNPQRIFLVNDDLTGIAAVGGCLSILLKAIVGKNNTLLTQVFQTVGAAGAIPACIDVAAYTGDIAGLEFLNVPADSRYTTDDFMTWNHWVDRPAPFVACLMDVAVADAAELDFDQDIVCSRIAPFKLKRCEPGSGSHACVSACR